MTKPKQKTDRCSGHCCQRFFLPLSPEELDLAYRRWKAGGTQIAMGDSKGLPIYTDIHLIAPMVVYLGYTGDGPRRTNPTDDDLCGKQEKGHHYSCKHWDPKTRDCTIYDIRPQMCREYPGGKGCNYSACTWESRKRKKETRAEVNARRRELTILAPSDGTPRRKGS